MVSVDRGGISQSQILLEVDGPFGSGVVSTLLCLPTGRRVKKKVFLPKGILEFSD